MHLCKVTIVKLGWLATINAPNTKCIYVHESDLNNHNIIENLRKILKHIPNGNIFKVRCPQTISTYTNKYASYIFYVYTNISAASKRAWWAFDARICSIHGARLNKPWRAAKHSHWFDFDVWFYQQTHILKASAKLYICLFLFRG